MKTYRNKSQTQCPRCGKAMFPVSSFFDLDPDWYEGGAFIVYRVCMHCSMTIREVWDEK